MRCQKRCQGAGDPPAIGGWGRLQLAPPAIRSWAIHSARTCLFHRNRPPRPPVVLDPAVGPHRGHLRRALPDCLQCATHRRKFAQMQKPKIIYTETDEAPALATYSLLP